MQCDTRIHKAQLAIALVRYAIFIFLCPSQCSLAAAGVTPWTGVLAAEVPFLFCNHTCRCSGKDVSLHVRSGVRVFQGGIAPGQPDFCNVAYNICGCLVWKLFHVHPFDAENVKVTSRFIIIIVI
jgi:hypothetical protein